MSQINRPGHNDVQASCTGFDFVMGEMFALRQFALNPMGTGLTGCVHKEPWEKQTTAVCKRTTTVTRSQLDSLIASGVITSKDAKRSSWSSRNVEVFNIPDRCSGLDPKCTCGIYGYHDKGAMAANSYESGMLYGVIRATGKTIVGTKGIRTEKAEIMGLAPVVKSPPRKVKLAGSRDDIYEQISTTDARIMNYKQDLLRLRAKTPPLPALAPLYRQRFEAPLLGAAFVLAALFIPVIVAAGMGVIPGSAMLLYSVLTLILAVSSVSYFEMGGQIRTREKILAESKVVLRKLHIAEESKKNLSDKLKTTKPPTWVDAPMEPKVPHHQARMIADKLGVPYYNSQEELLKAHSLSDPKDWMTEEDKKALADLKLREWNKAEIERLRKLLDSYKRSGLI